MPLPIVRRSGVVPEGSIAHQVPVRPAPTRISSAMNSTRWRSLISRTRRKYSGRGVEAPVGGSSTGASTPRPAYFRRVREICDRHRVLFIADEILVGAGRTGTWWAIEPSGTTPDLLTMGKG